MVRLPVRILAVFALAGLAFGVVSLSKLGSSNAQDVAPPGSSPPSAGGIPDGVPGSSGDSDGSSGSGVSSGPDQTVSSVVNPNEPAFEWTLERMLLATPMPMTQEERVFLSKHPALEKIREWSQGQFDVYIDSELGLRQAAQEGFRWRDLVSMLKKQQAAGAKFLKKSSKKVPVLPPSEPGPLDTADLQQFQKLVQEDHKAAFAKLKQWREEIAILAASVESMRREAEKKGQGDSFGEALNAGE